MLCFRKNLNQFGKLTLLLGLSICLSVANAEGIVVAKAEINAVDGNYEIWADFVITLPPTVEEALKHGVVLNFVSELAIMRSRWYWLDSAVTQNEQITKLSYNALTQQYRLSRGTLFQSFQNLKSALHVLGHQSAPPFPATALNGGGGYVARMLKSETNYTAFVQMRLDTSQLPKPLQVNAFTSNDWNLESEKYSWPVKSDSSEMREAPPP